MTRPSDHRAEQAYTRASVEAYLRAAADERARIESAIAAAGARLAWVRREEEQLDAAADATGQVPAVTERVDEAAIDPSANGSEWSPVDVPTSIAYD